ncbi:MAG: tetratricopeptide repeat protein [Planctomycetes bacterium]|nr:tetratricopeptide repeat protein [Planctomycetota bacterium]
MEHARPNQASLPEALRQLRAGQLDTAAAECAEILRRDPSNADALHLLGLIALQRRSFQEAVDWMEEALALNRRAPVFHHNIAAAYRALGRFIEAEAHSRTAIRLKPDYAEAYFNLVAVRRFTPGDPLISEIEKRLRQGRGGASPLRIVVSSILRQGRSMTTLAASTKPLVIISAAIGQCRLGSILKNIGASWKASWQRLRKRP